MNVNPKIVKDSKHTEKEIISFVSRMVAYGKKGIDDNKTLVNYQKCRDYNKGNHKIKNRPIALGNKVFNKYAEIMKIVTAHVLSKKAKFQFLPRQEGWQLEAARSLNHIIGDVIWDINKWDERGEDSILEARDAGTSHIKCMVDSFGFPKGMPLSVSELILDPKAKKKRQLRYWIHVYPLSVTYIKDEYGVEVSPEAILENKDNLSTNYEVMHSYESSGDHTAPSKVWDRTIFSENYDKTKWMPDIIGRAMAYEYWGEDLIKEPIPFNNKEILAEHETFKELRNAEVLPEQHHPNHIKAHEKYLAALNEELDKNQIQIIFQHIKEHSNYPQKEKRRKYPYGRKIVVCQNKLLEDQPNPIAAQMEYGIDFKDLLIKWDWEKLPNEYWGKPCGYDLIEPQDALNERKNQIGQMIKRLNVGIKTMRSRSYNSLRGNLGKFNNLLDQIIPVKEHDDFKIDFGGQFPSQIFEDQYHTEVSMEKLANKTDILAGNFPKGSPPGITVNQLLGQGLQPINLIVKHYAYALQEMARVFLQLMIEFVPEHIIFRIIGQDEKTNMEIYQFVEWGKLKEQAGKFDIHIDVNVLLETTRQEVYDQAMRMFEIGLYDRQAALEKVDDPDKWKTLQRISEILQLKQENAMLKENLDQASKQINTMINRQQSTEGKGNVSAIKTKS